MGRWAEPCLPPGCPRLPAPAAPRGGCVVRGQARKALVCLLQVRGCVYLLLGVCRYLPVFKFPLKWLRIVKVYLKVGSTVLFLQPPPPPLVISNLARLFPARAISSDLQSEGQCVCSALLLSRFFSHSHWHYECKERAFSSACVFS